MAYAKNELSQRTELWNEMQNIGANVQGV
ncbi:hypothetical protein RDI58_020495 [Solanum bulbocastanum]|uniref:Uncharacterized protein n=1 Tax=Solanum bulbocastanum TaxID=147425 RepID=A0AAN8T797_SOLBU